MLNYRTIFFISCCYWLCSCKPTSKSFSYSTNVDKRFFEKTMALAGLQNMKTDSIKIYRAELTERLVERDEIPEYRLINEKSEQEYAKLNDIKSKNFLYLFQLFPGNGTDTVFVYMATGFTATGICTSLGPVYLGMQRRDRIQFKSILKIKRMNGQPSVVKEKNAAGEIIKRYQIDQKLDTAHIIFYNDKRFPGPADRITALRIIQVIRDEKNKIGGTKAEIFTTEKVFDDPRALVFTYYSTIK